MHFLWLDVMYFEENNKEDNSQLTIIVKSMY